MGLPENLTAFLSKGSSTPTTSGPALSAALQSFLGAPAPRNQFAAGVSSGVDQLKGLTYGLASMAGDALNHPELQAWGQKGYAESMARAGQEGINVSSMKDIHSVNDLVDYASAQIGQALPSIAISMGGGGLGGYLAKRLLTSSIEKALLAKSAESLTAKGLSDELATAAVQKTMATHTTVGAALGAAAANYPQNLGMAYTELKADPNVADPIPKALMASLGMSAVEAAPFAAGVDAFVSHQLKQEVYKGFGDALLKNVPKLAAVSSASMGAQQAILMGTHAVSDPTYDWSGEEGKGRIMDALGSGALIGTLMGAGFGTAAHAFGAKAPKADGPGQEGSSSV